MVEHETEELINFGRRAVNVAIRKGAEEAEAFLSRISGTSINIERGQIVKSVRRIDNGVGLRVTYKKALGFAYTNMLNDEAIEDTAIKAVKSAKASKPDKNWIGLPNPTKISESGNTYDKKLTTLSPDDLVEIASIMLNAAKDHDKRVLPVGGGVETLFESRAIVNSHGVEAYDESTDIECSIATIAREASEVTPGCYELNAERIYKIDPEWVGREAARQAISSLKAKKIESGPLPVVFTQIAFYSLVYYTLINAVKADYVQRERSVLKEKIGDKVASDLVTIQDDGLLEGGLQTCRFDGEGVSSQNTLVIEKGTLKHFLFDSYTANKIGVESTGNAARRGLAPYTSTPALDATNFTFKPGNRSPEDLIEEIDAGLIIYGVQGAHSSNQETGEFSVVATPAWRIEKGTVTSAVKGAMLAGTIFDILQNVSALGNNTRKIGQLVAPWIKIENVKAI